MNRNITATILIVLALGIYFTFTEAKVAEVNAIRTVNDQYTSAIANADQLIQVRDQVLKNYNAINQGDRDRLDKMIPDTVDNIRLIIDLNSVAVRHGFSLKNIKAVANPAAPGATPVQASPSAGGGAGVSPLAAGLATPSLDTVTVTFSVTAGYQQFIDFLHDIEANLRIMDITHLSVVANDTGSYDFSVELKTYWLRQQ